MLTLNLNRSDAMRLPRPAAAEKGDAAADGGGGGAASTFWKVVATVATAILLWIGSQLIVVPTHSVQLQRLEASDITQNESLRKQDERLKEVERQQAAEKAGRDELIALLKAE